MKVILFAHTPPPHHGQSFMVQQFLEALGGSTTKRFDCSTDMKDDSALICHHVDARFSTGVADIGQLRLGKVVALWRYAWQAIRLRWQTGATCLIYIPAPAKTSAVLRDWLIMAICRPFFPQIVFWWQAAGLGEWMETDASPVQRWLTRALLGRPELSVILGEWSRIDAVALGSQRIVVVPNTVPDPCPPDASPVLQNRAARAAARARLNGKAETVTEPEAAGADRFRLIFLSLCTREKGLFDAMEGALLVNRRLAEAGSSLRVELAVAGEFPDPAERVEFDRLAKTPEWNDANGRRLIRFHGFVEGSAKTELLRDSDCLCFPTYYSAETFGLVLIEAMAWGLHIITSRWRSIPDLFPAGFDGLVEPQQPQQIADAIERRLFRPPDAQLRRRYEERFTPDRCFGAIRKALLELETPTRQ